MADGCARLRNGSNQARNRFAQLFASVLLALAIAKSRVSAAVVTAALQPLFSHNCASWACVLWRETPHWSRTGQWHHTCSLQLHNHGGGLQPGREEKAATRRSPRLAPKTTELPPPLADAPAAHATPPQPPHLLFFMLRLTVRYTVLLLGAEQDVYKIDSSRTVTVKFWACWMKIG